VTEVVTDSGEDRIDGIALAVPEVIAAHSVLGPEVADAGSTAERLRSSRLIFGVTRRFCPERNTLNCNRAAHCGRGSLLSVKRRSTMLPISASISGMTVASVWPGSVWVTS
jgi:hypothetical protein